MPHPHEATDTDERLARLLEIERRLEARVRDAEEQARARVDGARNAAQQAKPDDSALLEATARTEEDAELARHAAELARIAAEGAAHVARLSSIPGTTIERLALRAIATVLAKEEAGRP
jgi:multidrug resistance efflux pump